MPKLEAKVKDSYTMGAVTAFSGREYVRSEWRLVPVGSEEAAQAHPLLDVREFGVPHPEEVPASPEPAPAVPVETIIEEEVPARPMTVADYQTLAVEPPAAAPPTAPKEEPVRPRRRKSGKE